MCFNAPVSLITYIIGSIFCFLLINRNKHHERPIGYFLLFVIQMQILEYILWKNQECNNINKLTTNIAAYFNNLQPFVLYIIIVYFMGYNNIHTSIHIILFLYLIICIIFTEYVLKNINCTLADCPNSIHLYWKWVSYKYSWLFYIFYFIISFMLLFIYIRPLWISYLFLITFSLSYIIYYKVKAIGAMWCFFAALCPAILYYLL
jgi:hypothetical protein